MGYCSGPCRLPPSIAPSDQSCSHKVPLECWISNIQNQRKQVESNATGALLLQGTSTDPSQCIELFELLHKNEALKSS